MIRIQSVELREIQLPLVHYFETSFGRTCVRRIILLTVRADGGVGYGECTASEDPYYNAETTGTAWHILSDYVLPRVLDLPLADAAETEAVLRPIRGNQMAKATLETAVWDLEARSLGVPLARHIGGVRERIVSGVSIGIHGTVAELLTKVRREVAAGYRRIKIKIKPDWEIEPLKAIRAEFPEIPLSVDANSAFSLEDVALFERLDEFGLMMIEQPLAHDDIVDHAQLQRRIRTPICLDESIHHAEDVRRAVELGSCRIINVKLGRVGGFSEAIRISAYCARNNVPVWCGGMLESGIGRAQNIALSTLPAFTLPGDVSASERYFEEDTIKPPVRVGSDGTIRVPEGPGIGFEPNWERIERATVRKQEFRREKSR